MKKKAICVSAVWLVVFTTLGFAGCESDINYSIPANSAEDSDQRIDTKVVRTYEKTDSALTKEYLENDELITIVKYYEMSDGTWETDDNTYKYRLEITGRMGGAIRDSTFVYLSNIDEISFERAYMAAGLSSNLNDYFKPEEAALVAIK